MPSRPAIPAAIVREILVESGHRCAVCGVGCPLERAHIVPWRKAKEHKADNLICLCANCHQRADVEDWGEKSLREYKRNPWILRHSGGANSYSPSAPLQENRQRGMAASSSGKVRITMEIELDDFRLRFKNLLRFALAAFLDISPDSIRFISESRGSTVVVAELPGGLAVYLETMFRNDDPGLISYIRPLHVVEISAVLPFFSRLARRLKSAMPYLQQAKSFVSLVLDFMQIYFLYWIAGMMLLTLVVEAQAGFRFDDLGLWLFVVPALLAYGIRQIWIYARKLWRE